jgi:hypothetical protein
MSSQIDFYITYMKKLACRNVQGYLQDFAFDDARNCSPAGAP